MPGVSLRAWERGQAARAIEPEGISRHVLHRRFAGTRAVDTRSENQLQPQLDLARWRGRGLDLTGR